MTILVDTSVWIDFFNGVTTPQSEALDRYLQTEQILMGDLILALQSAQHFRILRQKGLTVRKTIDCLIATWCIAHQTPLLYADRDFGPFVAHLGLRSAGA